jgi:hypothetical protein
MNQYSRLCSIQSKALGESGSCKLIIETSIAARGSFGDILGKTDENIPDLSKYVGPFFLYYIIRLYIY